MIQHAVIEGFEPDADVLTIHIALFVSLQTAARPRDLDHFKDQPRPSSEAPYAKVRTNDLGPRETREGPFPKRYECTVSARSANRV
jgi:hypothetical protein